MAEAQGGHSLTPTPARCARLHGWRKGRATRDVLPAWQQGGAGGASGGLEGGLDALSLGVGTRAGRQGAGRGGVVHGRVRRRLAASRLCCPSPLRAPLVPPGDVSPSGARLPARLRRCTPYTHTRAATTPPPHASGSLARAPGEGTWQATGCLPPLPASTRPSHAQAPGTSRRWAAPPSASTPARSRCATRTTAATTTATTTRGGTTAPTTPRRGRRRRRWPRPPLLRFPPPPRCRSARALVSCGRAPLAA